MNTVVSFSGGKDSTAMLHWLIEKGEEIHAVVFCDTGWEFPEMYTHIEAVEKNTGVKITRVSPNKPFLYWMLHHRIVSRKTKQVERVGYSWPSSMRRWCTREKAAALERFFKGVVNLELCLGYAADEPERPNTTTMKSKKYARRYPLIEWGKTEYDCINLCRKLGYTWGGLYEKFHRVSCFCCPLQPLWNLKKLWKYYPELWQQMLSWEKQMQNSIGFRGYKSVHDLDERFNKEGWSPLLPYLDPESKQEKK